MKISLKELAEDAFTGPPVKREISWEHDGEEYTADVYIRKLSYYSAVSDVKALATDGDIAAHRIATCVVDENGDPVFTASDVTGYKDGKPILKDNGEERGALPWSLSMALLTVIGEVNDLGKK